MWSLGNRVLLLVLLLLCNNCLSAAEETASNSVTNNFNNNKNHDANAATTKAAIEETRRHLQKVVGSSSSNSRPRIINGQDAGENRYPYTVSIQEVQDLVHLCGGTLIAPDMVLTIGACVHPLGAHGLAVRINGYRLSQPLADSELVAVSEIVNVALPTSGSSSSSGLALLVLANPSAQPYVTLNDNPALPVELETPLVAMGWGTTLVGLDVPPPVLQQVSMRGLTNVNCLELTQNGNLGTYQDILTDDLLCALNDVQGPCTGDEGGPLIMVDGTNDPTRDVMVGVLVAVPYCAQIVYPSLYARTSFNFQTLRTLVCGLSVSAPPYFACDQAETLSPMAAAPVTPSPTVPLPTPPPVTAGAEQLVTVFIKFDELPAHTGYAIGDVDGNVVVQQIAFDAFVGESYTTTFALNAGQVYRFALSDAVGDGICCGGYGAVYLGDTVADDQVLAFVDGRSFRDVGLSEPFVVGPESTFTATLSPTLSPTKSVQPSVSAQPTVSQVTVTVALLLDDFPLHVGWVIVDLATEETVQSVDPGIYQVTDANTIVNATFTLDEGATYAFVLVDTAEDGFAGPGGNGFGAVYLGDEIRNDMLLAYLSASFQFQDFAIFLASEQGLITLSPTAAPSVPNPVNVTVVVNFDFLSAETGWSIGETVNRQPVFDQPIGTYGFELFNSQIQQPVELLPNAEYILVVLDSRGDGMCCQFGQGNITVYLGTDTTSPDAIVLAFDDGQFTFNRATTFFVPDPNTAAPVTAAPVVAPVPSTPAAFPVAPQCFVCGDANLSVGAPTVFLPDVGVTCGDLEFIGLSGGIPVATCEVLPGFVEPCECSPRTPGATAAPVMAPVPMTPAAFPVAPPCDVCGDANLAVGAPTVFLPEFGVTCGELELIGAAGGIPVALCAGLGQIVVPCSCTLVVDGDTPAPVTLPPITIDDTEAPITPAPITLAPITPAPVTPAPVTPAPVTPAPVTPAPVTPAPVTPAPVTPAPVTPAPVTPAPTMEPIPATPPPNKMLPTYAPVVYSPPTFAPTEEPRKGGGKMKKKDNKKSSDKSKKGAKRV